MLAMPIETDLPAPTPGAGGLAEPAAAAERAAVTERRSAAERTIVAERTTVAERADVAVDHSGDGFFWGIGLQGGLTPGVDLVAAGGGLECLWAFGATELAASGWVRTMSQSTAHATHWGAGLTARHRIDFDWVSVFAGGGLAWTGMDVANPGPADAAFFGEGSGAAGLLEVGVEMLRRRDVRLILEVTAELPFYTAQGELARDDGGVDRREAYLVPLGAGLSYLW